MKNCVSIFVSAIMLVAAATTAAAGTTLIHAGELLAIPGGPTTRNQTIVVEDGQIKEVRNGFASAADFDSDTKIIDLSKQFVLPGLMDMHVHLQF